MRLCEVTEMAQLVAEWAGPTASQHVFSVDARSWAHTLCSPCT